MAKFTIGDLKKIIKEEVRVHLKNKMLSEGRLLNEQDGDKIFKITNKDRSNVIFVGVNGDKVYLYKNVTKPGDATFKFEPTGVLIGGGDIATFVNGVKAEKMNYPKKGIHANGQKISDINNYFLNKVPNPETIAYGFVVDGGVPVLVGYSTVSNDAAGFPKPLMNIKGVELQGETPSPKPKIGIDSIPTGDTQSVMPEYVELNADFKFDSDVLINDAEFTQQLTNYLNEFTKPQYQYLRKHQPLPLAVAASASIDTPNAKYDYELTVKRVNAIARKIGEITQSNPKIPRFQVKPMPLGQTDRFKKGVMAPKFNRSQTAVNRKVIVGPIAKVNAFLAKYPGEVNKG